MCLIIFFSLVFFISFHFFSFQASCDISWRTCFKRVRFQRLLARHIENQQKLCETARVHRISAWRQSWRLSWRHRHVIVMRDVISECRLSWIWSAHCGQRASSVHRSGNVILL